MQFEHHVLLRIDLGVHDGFARGRNALIFIFDPLSTNVKLDLFLFKLIEKGKLVNSAPTIGNIHREIRTSTFLPSGLETEAGISTFIAASLRSLDLHVCLYISF